MKNKLMEMFQRYVNRFDDDYPMFMYNDTPEETVRKMQECLEKGKPVEELYPVTVPNDVVI